MNSVDDEEWDREDVQGVVEGDQAWRIESTGSMGLFGTRCAAEIAASCRVVIGTAGGAVDAGRT